MITKRVQNLFNFIDFLHSKMDYLLSKQPIIDKLSELMELKYSLSPVKNYKDKIEENKIQGELQKQFDIVENDTTKLIKDKIKELDIADISTPIINLNARQDFFNLKNSFDENDLKVITIAKNKYLEFRIKTRFHYFLQFFFNDLDRDLKELFDYFKDSTINEFESIEQLPNGIITTSLPIEWSTNSKIQQNRNETLPPEKNQSEQQIGNANKSKLDFTKDKLKETAKEYIQEYPVRLSLFLNEFEASESDYINKEIEYLEYTLYDLENSESSHDGHSFTGIENFAMAYDLVRQIGFDKFKYSTTRKIEFLESKKALPPHQTKSEHETPTFVNKFDNISPVEIYKHFKAGLVDKGYLTDQELNEYLKAAFELETKPETLFKLKHTPTKQKIYTVFYIYYKDIAQKKHERQQEYAALLGNYFEGYKTKIIRTNWARDYIAKR